MNGSPSFETSTCGNNFYIEIQRHGDHNEKLFENFNLQKSNEINIPILATNEVYYLDQSMNEAHDALICIGNKTYINEKKRIKFSTNIILNPTMK